MCCSSAVSCFWSATGLHHAPGLARFIIENHIETCPIQPKAAKVFDFGWFSWRLRSHRASMLLISHPHGLLRSLGPGPALPLAVAATRTMARPYFGFPPPFHIPLGPSGGQDRAKKCHEIAQKPPTRNKRPRHGYAPLATPADLLEPRPWLLGLRRQVELGAAALTAVPAGGWQLGNRGPHGLLDIVIASHIR